MRRHKRVAAGEIRMGVLTGLLLVVFPPIGIVLLWKRRWSSGLKYALSLVSVGILALAVVLIPNGSNRVNGGVTLVGAKKQADVYGPALPTAMVSSYSVGASESVLARTPMKKRLNTYTPRRDRRITIATPANLPTQVRRG